jgi:tRNA-Thr(GGU) m(6)t(6)A37 methyltransferase TsaA
MKIELSPIAYVRNARKTITDDDWGDVISEIILTDKFNAECLAGIDTFSHVEIIFYFDKVADSEINYTARHPRNNLDWPLVGIFAQRGKNRPNKIGSCIAQVVSCDGKILTVKGLDTIDTTPILDIKPVMKEFLPREKVKQPEWSTELMKNYWQIK